MAVALEKVKDFPDKISRWPVEMLIKIEVEDLKNKFSSLTMEIMERLRK